MKVVSSLVSALDKSNWNTCTVISKRGLYSGKYGIFLKKFVRSQTTTHNISTTNVSDLCTVHVYTHIHVYVNWASIVSMWKYMYVKHVTGQSNRTQFPPCYVSSYTCTLLLYRAMTYPYMCVPPLEVSVHATVAKMAHWTIAACLLFIEVRHAFACIA